MTEPIDLDAKRRSKVPKCEACGEPQHEYIGQCPRISGVTYETDEYAVTYHFWPVAGTDTV